MLQENFFKFSKLFENKIKIEIKMFKNNINALYLQGMIPICLSIVGRSCFLSPYTISRYSCCLYHLETVWIQDLKIKNNKKLKKNTNWNKSISLRSNNIPRGLRFYFVVFFFLIYEYTRYRRKLFDGFKKPVFSVISVWKVVSAKTIVLGAMFVYHWR